MCKSIGLAFDVEIKDSAVWNVTRDRAEWMVSVEAEHCGVDPEQEGSEEWGASNRPWRTGNYHLTTSPRQEYRYVRFVPAPIATFPVRSPRY